MRAAVIDGNGDFEIAEVPDPEPTPDQVLVEVAACGICGSDIHMRASGLVYPGMIMGHELSGTVVGVGAEVTGHPEGERVAVMPYLPCGTCGACRRNRPQVCANQLPTAMGVGPRPGGLAELTTAWPGQLFALPPDVPTFAGALAEPLAVGLHGVERSGATARDRAVVMGGGSIGVMTCLALRARGAEDFVVSEPSETRRSVLRTLGFEAVTPDALFAMDVPPDVVFDTTGVGPALTDAVRIVRPCGTVVLMGVVERPTEVLPVQWLLKEIDVRTALAYGRCFGDAVAALGDGRVDVATLAAARVPLADTTDAFGRLATADAPPKILIEPGRL